LPSAPAHHQRGNRFLAALPADIRAALKHDMHEAVLAQGTILLEPGDAIGQIYFPQTGMISLLVVTRKGDMLETSTIGSEGAVGLHRGLGERWSFTRATVQVAGSFSTIAAAPFQRTVQRYPPIRDFIAAYTERLLLETQQTAACNAMHDASSRLCRWLLQSADRIDADPLPLTQEFLSHMLGVRRTTLTLLARALQQRGIIKYSRGKIRIVDRVLLEACACECYEVIHREAHWPRIPAQA
jgi:CRP-like cAMP-binding protein